MTSKKYKDYYNKKALEVDEMEFTYGHKNLYKNFFYNNRFRNVIRALEPKKGEKILDIGCGSGFYTSYLDKEGCVVTATDLSMEYVKKTRQLCSKKVRTIVADATSLPFPDNTFDKILMTEVIEHVPQYKKALKEAIRVLRPDGLAVISTPNLNSYMNKAYHLKAHFKKFEFHEHVVEFTEKSFSKLLLREGKLLSLSYCTYTLPYPIDLIAMKLSFIKLISILQRIEDILGKSPITKKAGWTMIATIIKK